MTLMHLAGFTSIHTGRALPACKPEGGLPTTTDAGAVTCELCRQTRRFEQLVAGEGDHQPPLVLVGGRQRSA